MIAGNCSTVEALDSVACRVAHFEQGGAALG
jgi:hypothetical protein